MNDFNIVPLENESTTIEQLEDEPIGIEQYVPTGTVTVHRISTDEAITYSAGHLSTWVTEFEVDLYEGKFDQP